MSLPGEPETSKRVQLERAGSPVPSCLSMKSDRSMDLPPVKLQGELTDDPRFQGSAEPSCLLEMRDQSMDLTLTKKLLQSTLIKLKNEWKQFKRHLSQEYPECIRSKSKDHAVLDVESQVEEHEVLDIIENMLESCGRKRSLKITLDILRSMKQKGIADSLEKDNLHNESVIRDHQKLKTVLWKKFECIFEGLAKQGYPTLLKEIYIELYITEGGSGGVSNEHEVRQIERVSKRQTIQETAILCNDIFKPLPGQTQSIRTVLTKGIAGIGKTVSVQKFILDWAEGKANQDIHFIFPLPFRDLNLKKGREFSLMELLQHYFPDLQEIKRAEHEEVKVLFIFDGLDECRLPLDFQKNEILCDVTRQTSVDMLLTNLIKGNLLPSALVWITSRPAAANQIPAKCVHQVTEVRGFSDPQKEEYFRKRISDQDLASRIMSYIKSSRSLYIMCHIPVFCWVSATVLEKLMGGAGSGEIPKTLTGMFTHFLLLQTNVKNQKYHGTSMTNPKRMSVSDTEIILKLGQLAFQQLEKGNLIFYEEDLRECGIDVSEASVHSGVCTEIFKEETGLYQDKVFCFVHLSMQEYLAALFVLHSFVNKKRNVLQTDEGGMYGFFMWHLGDRMLLSDLHRSAVDQALQSKNGHLDLFLRFLLGLTLDSNQRLLQGLLIQTGSKAQSIEETVEYIKEKIRWESSAERSINLFHCLSEVNDNSLVGEIQAFLRPGKLSDQELEPHHCSALAFVLLMSDEVLELFDLKMYNTSAAGRQRLVSVVKNCRKAILDGCDLTEESCDTVASALLPVPSHLIVLDLSCNNLGDSGVERLCAGLKSANCKLQRLSLSECNLTEACCDNLASVLHSPHSELRDLELRDNDLQDSGVRALSAGLEDPHCKLQRLGLSGCQVTERGCASLASALHSNPSHLRELDLSYNHPGDSGLRALSAGLEDPRCSLETLHVDHGGENRNKPGLRKYACQLTLDPNTANRKLSLSEGDRRVTWGKEQPYPDHPERFDSCYQVLCRDGLSGTRYYWEAEWTGREEVSIAVTYKGIGRKGGGDHCRFGWNVNSWSMRCGESSYVVCHNKKRADIPAPPSPSPSRRVGVYLDWPAGTLSFYNASSDTLTLLYRVHTNFTQPLYPGFWVVGSVSLCQLD